VPEEYNTTLHGERIVPTSGGDWKWENIRDINYFLSNYSRCEDPFETYQQFVGEAYFFRASEYYDKLKSFGDVPWINKSLDDTSPELYAARDPRNEVADSIISDLDKAISLLMPLSKAPKNRVNKESAMLLKSSVALFEGTWEKYHAGTVFGVEGATGEKFLRIAADAAKALIDEGTLSLYKTGNPSMDYFNLFNQVDYDKISEVIFWKRYNLEEKITHNWQRYLPMSGGGTGLTRELIRSYLCTDGLPVETSGLYQGDLSLSDVIVNRDSRLHQTIWVYDDVRRVEQDGTELLFTQTGLDYPNAESVNTTGYQLKKGASTDWYMQENTSSGTTGHIVFRYAEALLNYAEARAELGELTQNDLDLSVNKLRSRVGMASMNLNALPVDPSPEHAGVSNLINEIRRERRVELACEGYRYDDIRRWAAAGYLIAGKRPMGAYFESDKYKPTFKPDLDENNYIDYYVKAMPAGYGFDISRDYLSPLPIDQLTLNTNLNQNPGWTE